jgi:hypothetical protein
VASFGPSKYFEVRELKSGAVQSMQWKPSIVPALEPPHNVGDMKTGASRTLEVREKLAKRQPLCFVHEGFAVAGAASERSVYVWDAERGDELLSLDHGGEFPNPNHEESLVILKNIKEGSKVRTLVVHRACSRCYTKQSTDSRLLNVGRLFGRR